MILDHLLAGAHDLAYFAIGQTLPHQSRHVNFLGGETLSRHHEFAPSLENMAMASFTRLRPSRIPARKKSVRRCCFTVRGLMLSWPAISLLLHPWTSRFKTCWSRGVTLTSFRSLTVGSFLLACSSLRNHASTENKSTSFANCSRRFTAGLTPMQASTYSLTPAFHFS